MKDSRKLRRCHGYARASDALLTRKPRPKHWVLKNSNVGVLPPSSDHNQKSNISGLNSPREQAATENNKRPITGVGAPGWATNTQPFDFKSHVLNIFQRRPAENANLFFVDGIRVISMLAVALGHFVVLSLAVLPTENAFSILDSRELKTILISRAALFVDVFFMLSGMVAVLTSVRAMRRRISAGVIKSGALVKHLLVAVCRTFLRLVLPVWVLILVTVKCPLFVHFYRFAAGKSEFASHIALGILARMVGGCWIRSWPAALLMHNHVEEGPACFIWTWYLAADWQSYLLIAIPVTCLLIFPARCRRTKALMYSGKAKKFVTAAVIFLTVSLLATQLQGFIKAYQLGLLRIVEELGLGGDAKNAPETSAMDVATLNEFFNADDKHMNKGLSINSVLDLNLSTPFRDYYTSTLVRAPPYIVGALLGVYLVLFMLDDNGSFRELAPPSQKETATLVQLTSAEDSDSAASDGDNCKPKVLRTAERNIDLWLQSIRKGARCVFWIAATLVALSFLEAFPSLDQPLLNSIVVASSHMVVGILIASFTVSALLGDVRTSKKFLSSSLLAPLAKISSSFYMTHMFVEGIIIARSHHGMPQGIPVIPTGIAFLFHVLPSSLLVAAFFHVFVERPSAILTDRFASYLQSHFC